MELDVNTLHLEFKDLLSERNVFLVSGVDKNHVKLHMGFVIEDVVDDISRWWRKYYNCSAQGIRGKLKIFRKDDNFSYDEEVKLKDGYIYLSYISSREFEFIFTTDANPGYSNTQYNQYKLVVCV